ncbi:MAG TPA: HAD-IA family hydrolase [Candidatus Saccharimonadales bacterium]|nr:HAD-IA family hydrolase [Candidatus Saccharimonadales bacterium]
MSIKLLIFDLDGVLCDSKLLHYETLNKALATINPIYQIAYDDHLENYDGLPTKEKLKLLTKYKQLPIDVYDHVWQLKQSMTADVVDDVIQYDQKLNAIFTMLSKNYKMVCASNSIWKTVIRILSKLDILKYMDYIISNDDVKYAKPHPDMYYECMKRFHCTPYNTLIFEDSPIGRRAALSSGAYLCPIIDPEDLTMTKIENYIYMCNTNCITNQLIWKNPINIVIPMAGMGSRFIQDGYKTPKPLIHIKGKTMIEHVISNLNINGQYIFIVQQKHLSTDLVDKLNQAAPSCIIIPIDYITEGAACTVLLAEKYINTTTPLLIANSDQYVEWDANEFMLMNEINKVDGAIVTFKSNESRWSYAKIDPVTKNVTSVREKEVISNDATVGIYYYKQGNTFVSCAKQMIAKNNRVNNEFYVCPVFNDMIDHGYCITTYACKKMWGMGISDDLVIFMKEYLKATNNDLIKAKE